MQPEAFLPPPFPSNAPLRPYISNMAVQPSVRRQGVAAALLTHAVRTASRWVETSVWLHVGTANAAARKLYTSAGFKAPATLDGRSRLSNLVPGPWSQILLAMTIEGNAGGGWIGRWAAVQEARKSAEAAAAPAAAAEAVAVPVPAATAAAEAEAEAAAEGGGTPSESSSSGSGNGSGSGSNSSGGGAVFQWQQLVADELGRPEA